jgi:hypothetical protein
MVMIFGGEQQSPEAAALWGEAPNDPDQTTQLLLPQTQIFTLQEQLPRSLTFLALLISL